MRDPDEIVIEDLRYRHTLEDAKAIVYDYINERFFHKDTKLTAEKDGTYSATDFSSYGATIIIEQVACT